VDPEDEPTVVRHRERRVAWPRLLQFGVFLSIVVLGVYMAATDRIDSAMVFVGLPALLALVIVLSPPAKNIHGKTFKAVSLSLLLCGAMVREGIICILMAAPLVYFVAHVVAAMMDKPPAKRTYAVVPIALAVGLEGFIPGLRVVPDQTVTVTRTVALAPEVVAQRIATGPDFANASHPLVLAMSPLPGHVTGRGIEVGDGWDFAFHGDNHGPGGELLVRVAGIQRGQTGGRVDFAVVSDTSVVHRWLTWTGAELAWSGAPGRTAVTLTLHFTRALDPSWYFGPIEQFMVGSAGDVILDSLGLRDA
jgi:hypothetical protein